MRAVSNASEHKSASQHQNCTVISEAFVDMLATTQWMSHIHSDLSEPARAFRRYRTSLAWAPGNVSVVTPFTTSHWRSTNSWLPVRS